MHFKSRSVFLLWFVFFPLFGNTQVSKQGKNIFTLEAVKKTKFSQSKLQSYLKELFATHKNIIWGVDVHLLNTKKNIFSLNSQYCFTPASNQKIVTAASTLYLLDSLFQYRSEVWATEKITKDKITKDKGYKGNLVIWSNGNPSLSQRWLRGDTLFSFFQKISDTLKTQGITTIYSDVIADNRFFEQTKISNAGFGEDVDYISSWEWDDLTSNISAISPISFNENIVQANFYSDAKNKKMDISFYPDIDYLNVKTNLFLTKEKSDYTIQQKFNTNQISVFGSINRNDIQFQNVFKIQNPVEFFLYHLKKNFEKNGIKVNGTFRSWQPKDTVLSLVEKIHTEKSSSMISLLQAMMQESSNFLAENTFRSLGAFKYGGTGTTKKSIVAIHSFYNHINIDTSLTVIADGSGLSSKNAIRVQDISTILQYYYGKSFFPSFKNIFPVSGMSGTLRERLSDKLTIGKVYAKTGSLAQTRALSGYIHEKNKWISFSIIANKYTQRSYEIESMIDLAVSAITKWMSDSR